MRNIYWFTLFLLLPAIVIASEFSSRVWENDRKALESQVLEPLAERFKDAKCMPGMGNYVTAYSDSLVEIRSSISSKSYLLFREIALSTGEEYHHVKDAVNCETIHLWSVFAHNIRKKINLLGNVFAIIE